MIAPPAEIHPFLQGKQGAQQHPGRDENGGMHEQELCAFLPARIHIQFSQDTGDEVFPTRDRKVAISRNREALSNCRRRTHSNSRNEVAASQKNAPGSEVRLTALVKVTELD